MSKRKSTTTTSTNGNDSDGSDYEVEWQVKPTPAKTKPTTKAEQFPLPARIEKNLQNLAHAAREDSSSDESDDAADALPTLTDEQMAGVLKTVKNNKRFVLIVKNVDFTTAKEEIEQHFDQAGLVKGVRIPKRRSSGFAFVEMRDAGGFQNAFLLDGSNLDGRKIRVQLSESGKKKSSTRLKLLERKNAEILKMRKKNRKHDRGAKVSLVPAVPAVEKKPPPPDKILDKVKPKRLTTKEMKQQKQNVSLKAKFKNLAKKGIKA